MISFLNPLFLAFGGAVLVPLVLHMIQSSRTVRLPFSTIRFLRIASQRSSRRIKMENFLLWLLRTLLMVLLTLAFAMPMIRTKSFGRMLGRAPRDVAIIVDASYSMEYKTGRQAVWDEAIDVAVSLLDGLTDKDRFCIYFAGDSIIPICPQLGEKKEEAIARLRTLKPAIGSSQLCPAVLAGCATLEKEKRQPEREIHIISDRQALPWTGFKRLEGDAAAAGGTAGAGRRPATATGTVAAAGSVWDPERINEKTTLFVTLLGPSRPENTAPVSLDVEPRLVTDKTSCKLTARLARIGPPQDTTVTVYVDDKEISRRSVQAEGLTGSQAEFVIPPVGPGTHTVRVETPDDSLSRDNTLYSLIRAKQKLPVLCVGSRENTFFLQAALSAAVGGDSVMDAKFIQPDRLVDETLSAYNCIFLCDVIPLPGQDLTALEYYVKSGGLLTFFPGDAAAVADYEAWSCLPSIPTDVADLPLSERKRLLNWEKPQHPMLVGFKEGGLAPTLAIKRQLKCDKLAEKAEALISTGAGYPFLLSRPIGRGEVLMFTVASDRSWSDFPLSPFYLPIIHQVVQYAAGVGASAPFLWTTDSLSLREHLPEATKDSVLRDPDGTALSVWSAIVDGQSALYAEGLTKPGIYTLTGPKDPAAVPALAMNVPRTESDLTPIRTEDLVALLGVKDLQVAESKDELFRKIENFRIGKTFGEQILWLVLLVAALESFYANRLSRKAPKLSDALLIDPSGRVKDKH